LTSDNPIVLFCVQLGWSAGTKAKLKNAEIPRDVQTAELLLNEHKDLADDIAAHKPRSVFHGVWLALLDYTSFTD